MSLIDNFQGLIDSHHNVLNNFPMVGAALEAAGKIYEYKVDSVHTDVLRMSSTLNGRYGMCR